MAGDRMQTLCKAAEARFVRTIRDLPTRSLQPDTKPLVGEAPACTAPHDLRSASQSVRCVCSTGLRRGNVQAKNHLVGRGEADPLTGPRVVEPQLRKTERVFIISVFHRGWRQLLIDASDRVFMRQHVTTAAVVGHQVNRFIALLRCAAAPQESKG